MMHSNEGASPPSAGAALLLELGTLIVSSRSNGRKTNSVGTPTHQRHGSTTRATETATSGAWNDVQLHQRILAAKLLNRSSQERPSTSASVQQLPITDVQAKVAALSRENSGLVHASAVSTAVARARRALFIDKHLKGHVEGLWNEHIPLSIEVLLGPDCPECYARASDPYDPDTGQTDIARDGLLLLERWTLSIYHKKAHEKTQQITSQWLLNAVRSQLHFSQISAWNAKIKEEGTKKDKSAESAGGQEQGESRQRKLSRETCNFKKLEANCDDPQLLRSSGSLSDRGKDQQETRNLNIVYSLKIPGETYKMAEFMRTPNEHTFPITDIGSNVFLKVILESSPRSEEIPVVRCSCRSSNPSTMKRRRSKDCLLLDELMNISSDSSEGYDLRCKGATFSPDLTIINPNMGCASGITRRLSIFTGADNIEYQSGNSLSRGSTPEKLLFNDSGFPCSRTATPVDDGCSSRCKRPLLDPSLYSNVPGDNVFQTNYMLVDDRMQTPCSESGKHRCYCDEEPEPSTASSYRPPENEDSKPKSKLEQKYLKELAKQRRKLRKEEKLSKLRESEGDKDLELESNCDKIGSHFHDQSSERRYGRTATSIPILQASRFDRFVGGFRQPVFLSLQTRKPASCACQRKESFSPCDYRPSDKRRPAAVMISVSTQTEPMQCDCGRSLKSKCERCFDVRLENPPGLKRSDENRNLAGISKSTILLEAIERTSRRHEIMKPDTSCSSAEIESGIGVAPDRKKEEVGDTTLNCDNTIRNLINRACDTYLSLDGSDSFKASSLNVMFSDASMSTKDDEERSFDGLIKRPKLKRQTATVDRRIDKVLTDRVRIQSKSATLNDDDSTFAFTSVAEEATPLNRRKNSSMSDDELVACERGDYGTFDPIEDLDAARSGDGAEVPSSSDMVRFRWRLDSAASMVFHANTGLPLTSSPAPLKRGNTCFDYDSSINSVSSIRSALFHPTPDADQSCWSPGSSPGSPASVLMPLLPWVPAQRPATPPARLVASPLGSRVTSGKKIRLGPRSGLLGTFEESALKGRLEPAATVAGFTAELGASGAFCPAHKRLPVTVFFYSLGGNAAPYLGHINLGRRGYNVPSSGTIQVTLFNPHGTVVKMFVVPYDLADMPAGCRTFLRQRTLYLPAGTETPTPSQAHKWLRYLIHLRFMTSKSGKLYLHTDIRIIVSRKADLDTAAAHSPLALAHTHPLSALLGGQRGVASDPDQDEVSYELRSFTYTPDNPKFSPR